MIDTRIKALREKENISQKELAKNLGVSSSTIAMYETGKRNPDSDMLKRIGDYFNVSVDYLLGRTVSHCSPDIFQDYRSRSYRTLLNSILTPAFFKRLIGETTLLTVPLQSFHRLDIGAGLSVFPSIHGRKRNTESVAEFCLIHQTR